MVISCSNSLPARQLVGQPGRGQRLEHLRAARRQAGVAALPVRARGRQGEEVGDVGGQRVGDGDGLLGRAHADVDVDAEDLEAAGQPLHLLDQPGVAGVGADLLVGPVRERVGARAQEVEAPRAGERASSSASVPARSARASATVPHTPVMISMVDSSSSCLALGCPSGWPWPMLGEHLVAAPRSSRVRRSTSSSSHSTPRLGAARRGSRCAWAGTRIRPPRPAPCASVRGEPDRGAGRRVISSRRRAPVRGRGSVAPARWSSGHGDDVGVAEVVVEGGAARCTRWPRAARPSAQPGGAWPSTSHPHVAAARSRWRSPPPSAGEHEAPGGHRPAGRLAGGEQAGQQLEEDLGLAVAAHRPEHGVEVAVGPGDQGGRQGRRRAAPGPVLGRVAGLEREPDAAVVQEDAAPRARRRGSPSPTAFDWMRDTPMRSPSTDGEVDRAAAGVGLVAEPAGPSGSMAAARRGASRSGADERRRRRRPRAARPAGRGRRPGPPRRAGGPTRGRRGRRAGRGPRRSTRRPASGSPGCSAARSRRRGPRPAGRAASTQSAWSGPGRRRRTRRRPAASRPSPNSPPYHAVPPARPRWPAGAGPRPGRRTRSPGRTRPGGR